MFSIDSGKAIQPRNSGSQPKGCSNWVQRSASSRWLTMVLVINWVADDQRVGENEAPMGAIPARWFGAGAAGCG